MIERLNIVKDYTIDKSYDETISLLDKIVSANYDSTMYSTFGKRVSGSSEFIFMTKWYSIGKPFLAEVNSTKIRAIVYKLDNRAKITTVTKTNPVMFVIFFLMIILTIVNLVTSDTYSDAALSAVFLILACLTIVFDRLAKNMLIDRFERDLVAVNKP